jgi:ferredoxin
VWRRPPPNEHDEPDTADPFERDEGVGLFNQSIAMTTGAIRAISNRFPFNSHFGDVSSSTFGVGKNNADFNSVSFTIGPKLPEESIDLTFSTHDTGFYSCGDVAYFDPSNKKKKRPPQGQAPLRLMFLRRRFAERCVHCGVMACGGVCARIEGTAVQP